MSFNERLDDRNAPRPPTETRPWQRSRHRYWVGSRYGPHESNDRLPLVIRERKDLPQGLTRDQFPYFDLTEYRQRRAHDSIRGHRSVVGSLMERSHFRPSRLSGSDPPIHRRRLARCGSGRGLLSVRWIFIAGYQPRTLQLVDATTVNDFRIRLFRGR